jgi:hypothetical protein
MIVQLFCFLLLLNNVIILCFHFVQKKHQNIFNVFEQALVLSGLTDYITCAFQNELFDTFRKKSDRDGLPTILITLNMQWVRFFQKLRQCGKSRPIAIC